MMTTMAFVPGKLFTKWKIMLVAGWALTAAGGAFGLVAAGCAVYETVFLSRSDEVRGVVIAMITSHVDADLTNNTPAQDVYCPQFQYRSADGVLRTMTS